MVPKTKRSFCTRNLELIFDVTAFFILSDTLTSSTGVRCLKLSLDGKHLAAGGRDGNISIFDATARDCTKIAVFEAHDQEVLVLEYTPTHAVIYSHRVQGGLIHIYDVDNGYLHLETIDDHTSSINSIKFFPVSCLKQSSNGFEMVTCATDKLVVIRHIQCLPSETHIERINQIFSQNRPWNETTRPW